MTSYSPAYKAEALASMGQQPNFSGGWNNQQPGQAPNMGVPNMGVPPAPMPYSPYPPQPSFGYNPYPPQPSFGMPQTYSPYPQQQSYGQMPPGGRNPEAAFPVMSGIQFGTGTQPSSGSLAQLLISMGGMSAIQNNPQLLQNPQLRDVFGMGGQQPTGGLSQPANTPQYTTYSAGPMGLPVSIDQSLMGGAATGNQQPTLAQWLAQTKSEMDAMLATKPQPSNQPSPYKGYGGYDMTGMSPTLQAYLKDASVQSAMDAAPYYTYNPTTKSFQAITMGGGFDKTLAEMEADAAAWDKRQKSLSTADQSPFGVKPIATPTIKPPTPNIAPKPKLTPQQIAQRNMMNLQQSLLEAGSRGPAGLQGFLDQLPKTGLTPQQVRAQQQAQMQLRNQQRLRNPSLSSDPFTYTPRPAAPVRPAPTPQVNQVTRRMNPNGTFSIA